MSQEIYLNIFESHLRNEQVYKRLEDNDHSLLLQNRIMADAKEYKRNTNRK